MSKIVENQFVIIKIGGAALTDKNNVETLRKDEELKMVFGNIKNIYETTKQTNKKLLLIHGAGSYGHFQAKKHNLYSITNKKSVKLVENNHIGISKTRQSVTKLNNLIVDYLLNNYDLPSIQIHPYHFLFYDKEENKVQGYNKLFDCINVNIGSGFLPILHGDVILSNDAVGYILSGRHYYV